MLIALQLWYFQLHFYCKSALILDFSYISFSVGISKLLEGILSHLIIEFVIFSFVGRLTFDLNQITVLLTDVVTLASHDSVHMILALVCWTSYRESFCAERDWFWKSLGSVCPYVIFSLSHLSSCHATRLSMRWKQGVVIKVTKCGRSSSTFGLVDVLLLLLQSSKLQHTSTLTRNLDWFSPASVVNGKWAIRGVESIWLIRSKT